MNKIYILLGSVNLLLCTWQDNINLWRFFIHNNLGDFYLSNNGSVYAWLYAVWCQFFGFDICLFKQNFSAQHNWFSAIFPVRAQHTPHNRQKLYPFVNFINVQCKWFWKMRSTNVGLSRCWWANNCTAHMCNPFLGFGWFVTPCNCVGGLSQTLSDPTLGLSI